MSKKTNKGIFLFGSSVLAGGILKAIIDAGLRYTNVMFEVDDPQILEENDEIRFIAEGFDSVEILSENLGIGKVVVPSQSWGWHTLTGYLYGIPTHTRKFMVYREGRNFYEVCNIETSKVSIRETRDKHFITEMNIPNISSIMGLQKGQYYEDKYTSEVSYTTVVENYVQKVYGSAVDWDQFAGMSSGSVSTNYDDEISREFRIEVSCYIDIKPFDALLSHKDTYKTSIKYILYPLGTSQLSSFIPDVKINNFTGKTFALKQEYRMKRRDFGGRTEGSSGFHTHYKQFSGTTSCVSFVGLYLLAVEPKFAQIINPIPRVRYEYLTYEGEVTGDAVII